MKDLNHIAIIPDGNRRWAKEHNLPTLEGHRRGFSSVEKMAKHIRSLGIHTLTVWAFSTENWNRSPEEIEYLMKLYQNWLKSNLKTAMKDGVRIIHLGRKDRINEGLRNMVHETEQKTKDHTKHVLGFALDYGGRDELIRAAAAMREANITPEKESDIEPFLDTKDFLHPNPDLIIRTSGEYRTSGFMSWQSAYSELFISDKNLPDFSIADLDAAIAQYHSRQRRFGK